MGAYLTWIESTLACNTDKLALRVETSLAEAEETLVNAKFARSKLELIVLALNCALDN